MREFLDEYCIHHGQSSRYHPENNGHAERMVGILKQLVIKTGNDITEKGFLMEYLSFATLQEKMVSLLHK